MKYILTYLLFICCLFVKAQTSIVVTTFYAGTLIPNKLTGKPQIQNIPIAAHDTLILYKFNVGNEMWTAKFKGTIGVVSDGIIEQTTPLILFKNIFINRDYKLSMIKKYGRLYGTDIYNGTIRQGMNKTMVEEVYGKPNDINRTVGDWGVHEQWVYNERSSGKTEYLYFENGKLTSWQD